MSAHTLRRVLPQVRAHAPDGARILGVLVTLDGFSLPVLLDDDERHPFVAYQAEEPVHRMSRVRWGSLLASGTAFAVADEHDDLRPPAPSASVAARDVWQIPTTP